MVALAALAADCSRDRPRPAVILVSIDTLRADHVGLYGYERDTTPFLDSYAEQCLVFDRAVTPISWTLAAHITMLSGLYPVQHGVMEDDLALSRDVPLLAERLREVGYQTVGLYFQGYIHERHGFGRGFDVFRHHLNAQEAGEHLEEELARLDPDRPFFLFLHLFDVHSKPFIATERSPYRSPEPYHDQFLPGAEERLPDASSLDIWKGDVALDAEQLEALVALYDGGVRYVDAQLEKWFGELTAEGWLENTLVVITADHGEALGQRDGRVRGHGGFFQEGLRVPLLIRHPLGERAGERVSGTVSLIDVVPTILGEVGLVTNEHLLGQSLFAPIPEDRIVTGSREPTQYFIQWPRKYMQRREYFGTWDLASDPGEERPSLNSGEEFERVSNALLGTPAGRYRPVPEPTDGPTPAQLAELRALGYIGDDE